MAAGTGFVHDGRTTYCWRIPASFMDKEPAWTSDVISSEARGCPLSMRIDLEATEVLAGAFVAVNWTATLNRARLADGANAVRHNQLVTVVDDATGHRVDVIHSNVHSCEFGSNCDPFRQGARFVDNTPNKVGNFSADDAVVFTSQQELRFPSSGIFSVLAHIIIPGVNSSSERFDYAVYQRLTVKEASAVAADKTSLPDSGAYVAPSDASSSLSGGAIAGIIIGTSAVVILVLLLVVRRRRALARQHSSSAPQRVLVPVIPPYDKSTFNDGYSELSSIPSLGRPRLGAAPHARGGMRSDYLSSGDPTLATVPASPHRPGEMHIRDFDPTLRRSTASYQFPSDDVANRSDDRPHDIVDSTLTVDFSYADSMMSDDLPVLRRERQHSGDDGDFSGTELETNDSYFITDLLSTTSSRIFLSDTELSAMVDSDRYTGRFSDRYSERSSDALDAQTAEL